MKEKLIVGQYVKIYQQIVMKLKMLLALTDTCYDASNNILDVFCSLKSYSTNFRFISKIFSHSVFKTDINKKFTFTKVIKSISYTYTCCIVAF